MSATSVSMAWLRFMCSSGRHTLFRPTSSCATLQHDHSWCNKRVRHQSTYRGDQPERLHSIWKKSTSHKPLPIYSQFCSTNNTQHLEPMKSNGYTFPDWTVSHTTKDIVLYALGVGVSSTQPDYLKFIFEKNENFSTLPSFAVIPAQKVVLDLIYGELPGLEDIDSTKVLHGEQYLEVYGAIPTTGTLTNKGTVVDVIDKRSGALVLIDVHTYNGDNDDQLAYNQFSLFIVGAGGFGGKRNSDHIKPTMRTPSIPPDVSVTQTTSIDQAALYRLSGDDNPLHIDPEAAKRGGFPRSITHGLCTFGFALRHVLHQYAVNDVTKLKQVKVRFSKPVFPGQTIRTDMWRENNRIYFQCHVTETGDIVISGAYVEFRDIQ